MAVFGIHLFPLQRLQDGSEDGNGTNLTDAAILLPTRAITLVNKSHWPILYLQLKKSAGHGGTHLQSQQRQVEFEPSLVYIKSSRIAKGYVETMSQKKNFFLILYVYVVCEYMLRHISGSHRETS